MKILKIPGDFIAVKFLPEDKVSSGGIHIPDTEIQAIRTAEVLLLGEKLSEPEIKVGNKVIVSIYDTYGQKIMVNGDEVRIFPTSAIMAIV